MFTMSLDLHISKQLVTTRFFAREMHDAADHLALYGRNTFDQLIMYCDEILQEMKSFIG